MSSRSFGSPSQPHRTHRHCDLQRKGLAFLLFTRWSLVLLMAAADQHGLHAGDAGRLLLQSSSTNNEKNARASPSTCIAIICYVMVLE